MSSIEPSLEWRPRHQHDRHRSALYLDGHLVATLSEKVTGGWFARLDVQQGIDVYRTRPCSSLEQGRRGCEAWALRHVDRLRAEIAASIKKRQPRTF